MQSIRIKCNKLIQKRDEMDEWKLVNIVKEIHDSERWELCKLQCEELCYRAGLERAWLDANDETFKCVLVTAALELGIAPVELGVVI